MDAVTGQAHSALSAGREREREDTVITSFIKMLRLRRTLRCQAKSKIIIYSFLHQKVLSFFLVQCSVIHTDANYSTIIASDHHRLVNIYLRRIKSSRFEQQNRLLIQIKVNKVVCFVGHIGTYIKT
ncbi:hypothetical protein EUGRSUZ_H03949 [Eucalyptus grandis]|uniref:Uncharacterized protein n=2 Tax=Eucalyptus grandis TaxID=71139 RepID=A0ACC3JWI7_EUCGR|nr:hypothetical protein EUGRSUZ_H03949 [Eucalyptus grandis]